MMLGHLSPSGIAEFWDHCKQLTPWSSHPHLNNPNLDLKKVVGLMVHGDGAEIFRDDEYFIYSFSSVFVSSHSEADPLMQKFPIAVLPEREMLKTKAACNREIARLVAWSLQHAATGVAPVKGFYGEDFPRGSFRAQLAGSVLARGYKGIYFSMKADLKARKEMHQFRAWYQCTRMCDLCHAEQFQPKHPLMYYKNLHPEAPYKLSGICHEFYLVAERGNISPWVAVEGWRLETCVFDILHNVFLGVARDTVASTLKALVLHGCFAHYGDDENEILAQVTVEMRRTCKQHGLLVKTHVFSCCWCCCCCSSSSSCSSSSCSSSSFFFFLLLLPLSLCLFSKVKFIFPVQLQRTTFCFHPVRPGSTFHGGGSLSQTWAPLAMKSMRNSVHDSKVLT